MSSIPVSRSRSAPNECTAPLTNDHAPSPSPLVRLVTVTRVCMNCQQEYRLRIPPHTTSSLASVRSARSTIAGEDAMCFTPSMPGSSNTSLSVDSAEGQDDDYCSLDCRTTNSLRIGRLFGRATVN